MADHGGMSTKPKYTGMGDWKGGAFGNDIDVATATTSDDYAPRTQAAKAALMAPNPGMAVDVTKDFGPFAGQTGRKGAIGPRDPYPTKAAP